MNKSFKINGKQVIAAILLCVTFSYGQDQSKKFQESFVVKDSAVLEINTSYVDIEFETWDKNEVLVEATIILEGATAEDAEQFFRNDPIVIIGNSKKINVSSGSDENVFFNISDINMREFHIEIPEIPEIPELEHFIVEIPEIAEISELLDIPPLPPMANFNFDYKAYKKDGDVYLNQWQKDFEKSFNKDYQKKIEAWSKRMETRKEKVVLKRAKMEMKREKIHAKHQEKREKIERKREEAQGQRIVVINKQRELKEARREINREVNSNKGKSTFYFSTNGASKNFNVKKTIKITLPKSIKMKMNVRHGAVKLAETTRNLKATLSHSNLSGDTIDGRGTMITASYSPVRVQKWNYGNLNADYAEYVAIDEVLYLNLNSTSSDVTIEKIFKGVVINNKFGPLQINSIDNAFEEINISMQNGELNCELPDTSCLLYIEGKATDVSCPESLDLTKANNGSIVTYRNNPNVGEDKSIIIKAEYSDIVLK